MLDRHPDRRPVQRHRGGDRLTVGVLGRGGHHPPDDLAVGPHRLDRPAQRRGPGQRSSRRVGRITQRRARGQIDIEHELLRRVGRADRPEALRPRLCRHRHEVGVARDRGVEDPVVLDTRRRRRAARHQLHTRVLKAHPLIRPLAKPHTRQGIGRLEALAPIDQVEIDRALVAALVLRAHRHERPKQPRAARAVLGHLSPIVTQEPSHPLAPAQPRATPDRGRQRTTERVGRKPPSRPAPQTTVRRPRRPPLITLTLRATPGAPVTGLPVRRPHLLQIRRRRITPGTIGHLLGRARRPARSRIKWRERAVAGLGQVGGCHRGSRERRRRQERQQPAASSARPATKHGGSPASEVHDTTKRGEPRGRRRAFKPAAPPM